MAIGFDILGTQTLRNMDNRNFDKETMDKMQTEHYQDWRANLNPHSQQPKQAQPPLPGSGRAEVGRPQQGSNNAQAPQQHTYNDQYQGGQEQLADSNQDMMAQWAAARRLMA